MYLDNYISSLKNLCQQNKVKSLYVFGSALNANFKKESDIDFLVKFKPKQKAFINKKICIGSLKVNAPN